MGFTVKFSVVHSAFLLQNYSKQPIIPNLSQFQIPKDELMILFLTVKLVFPTADDTGT